MTATMNDEMRERKQIILLLDDDANITEGLAFALEREDRTVITCNDAESAQLSLERFHPSIVICDVHVSGEFGFEGLDFIAYAKRHAPSARVILMTGDAPEKLQLEAASRGAVAFLQKPFEAAELDAMIDLMAPADNLEHRLPGRIDMPLLDRVLVDPRLGTHFQPIVALQEHRTPVAFEALTRYASATPLRNPDLLFEYATRKQRVFDLETVCVRHAMKEGAALAASSLLFINIHPDVFRTGVEFRELLRDCSQKAAIPLNRLVLELTEQSSLNDDARVFRLFDQLRTDGVRLAFDDVGVAYSHLPFIHRIRPEYLKISQHFGTAFESDSARTKLVRNLVALGREFECTVILEGIEDEATARAATELGVELGQGYLFGRPAPADSHVGAMASVTS